MERSHLHTVRLNRVVMVLTTHITPSHALLSYTIYSSRIRDKRTERCDDIASAGHKPLVYLVTFVKMSLFERGYKKWQLVA